MCLLLEILGFVELLLHFKGLVLESADDSMKPIRMYACISVKVFTFTLQ